MNGINTQSKHPNKATSLYMGKDGALPLQNFSPIEDGQKNESETRSDSKYDDVLFDFFGIKLHFDDILLIGLIFFLYSEGVNDEMLFISLILLLLS